MEDKKLILQQKGEKMIDGNLKQRVKKYWNAAACGTEFINKTKFSTDYFESIQDFRYGIEPEIFSFAQFTRFHGKKILEVGIGAGTDFLQWVKSGAEAYGIDLTEESISHAQQLLDQHGLKAREIKVADAENIPYKDNTFDLVYSWGVIHHSPDTIKCLEELIRVTKPGGKIKVMIYNKNSLFAFYLYLKNALLKCKPFQSFSTVIYNHQESPGTKAFSRKEIELILKKMPVSIIQIKSPVTNHDLLYYKSKIIQIIPYILASLFGWNRSGWFMQIELQKN
jgi:ubiquinone/menaquinone biosynthesis C-methylase UbiE